MNLIHFFDIAGWALSEGAVPVIVGAGLLVMNL
jgi:hypothetical protein